MSQKRIILTFTPQEGEAEADVDISIMDEGFDGDMNEVVRHIFLTAATLGDMIEAEERAQKGRTEVEPQEGN